MGLKQQKIKMILCYTKAHGGKNRSERGGSKKVIFIVYLKNSEELAEPGGSELGTINRHSSYKDLKVEGGVVGLGK